MSVLGSIGLAAAERLEKSVGPGVALRSYKALLGGGERDVMKRAALGAFRCALLLRDDLELAAVSAYWETLVDVDAFAEICAIVLPLALTGRGGDGVTIAAAEAKRRPSGKSAYLHARLLEAAERPSERAYTLAAELAGDDVALRSAARSKQLEAMLARGVDPDELLAVAEQIDLRLAAPSQRLIAAEVRLRATSRFARAAALSALVELAGSEDASLARRAIRLAAAHADAMGFSLSWVEADRIAAALSSWPGADERDAAMARLDARRRISAEGDTDEVIAAASGLAPGYEAHLSRARAVIEGAHIDSPPPTDDPELGVADHALCAIALLRDASWREAELAIRGLSEAPSPCRSGWVVARLASEGTPKGVALAALELIARMLDDGMSPPPEGFLPHAGLADRMRAAALRERLLRRAVHQREAGAIDLLVDELTQRARTAAVAGKRDEALSLLREAAALAG